MNLNYVNSKILQDLIEKIDTVSEQNDTNYIDNDSLFRLNFIISIRLRLIKPVLDLGDKGPLKISLKPGEYFYAISDVEKLNIVGNKQLASKYLLPWGSKSNITMTVEKGMIATFHSPLNKIYSKKISNKHSNLSYCIACLQYSQILWETLKEKSVKG